MVKKKKLKQGTAKTIQTHSLGSEVVHRPLTVKQNQSDTENKVSNIATDYKNFQMKRNTNEFKRQNTALSHEMATNKSSGGKPRITDQRLIPRIQEYLDGRSQKKYVSIEDIAEYLQRKYPEYSRRKQGVFTKYIEKAYSMMDHGSNSDSSNSDSEDINSENGSGVSDTKRRKMLNDDDSDCIIDEVLVEYKDTNAINNMMSSMYKNSPQHSEEPNANLTNSRQQLQDKHKQKLIKTSQSDAERNKNSNERHIESSEVFFIDKKGNGSTPLKHKPKTPKIAKSVTKNKQKDTRHVDENLSIITARVDPDSLAADDQIPDIVIDSDLDEQLPVNTEDCNTMVEPEKSNSKTTKKLKVKAKKRKNEDESSSRGVIGDGPTPQKSDVTFADIGGNEQNLVEICKLLVHMRHPEVYNQLGVTPPRGFLLHGPPGCGKTLLANAIAGELDLPMIKIAATEIVSGVSGDSEEKVRELFEKATQAAPCVLFIDEVDAITPKREIASKDMERRIVSQLLTCLDDLNKNKEAHVLVIGATNRPDSLDPALRRAGRFDKEISLGIPDETSRKRILEVLCRNLRLTPGFDFSYLAKFTPGYVGADLMSLTREAAMVAVNRVFKDLQSNNSCDKTPIPLNSTHKVCEPIDVMETTETLINDKVSGTEEASVDLSDIPHETNDGQSVIQSSTIESGVTVLQQTQDLLNEETVGDKTSNVDNVILSGDNTDNVLSDSHVYSKVYPSNCTDKETVVYNTDSVMQTHNDQESTLTSVEDPHIKELKSVLSWLKDQPPLTDKQLQDLFVTLEDFKLALKTVQPSAKREGFATVPDVTWEDIGALHHVREELQLAILAPVRHPEEFKALGLNKAQGILLAGPPGCGKTLLAKAVANESGINFISVKGPELLNMYVGESEKAVRTVFQRARNSSPCVIFFDELDALCPRRSGSAEGGSSTRVVNQLLTEMDGLEERKQVFIMAATNRPDIIDPAVLRPGRLDKTLYVGLPTLPDRIDILRCLTKNGTQPTLASDVDMNVVAGDQRCENYTGADLAALVREASISALKEAIAQPNRPAGETIQVNQAHFETAFKKIKPSVSDKDRERYANMGNRLAIDDS